MKVKPNIIQKEQKSYYLFPPYPEKEKIKTAFIHQEIDLLTIGVNKLALSTKIACSRSIKK
jgi:hypothetical protein